MLRPSTLREWVVVVYAAIGLGLLPWTLILASSLKPRHVTESWDLAWTAFDCALAVMFLATSYAAYRRSPWLASLAAATGTMLVTDAWFDIVLESHADERRTAVILAVLAELPAAALCFWIAYRAERFLALVVERALHVAPPGEGAPEGDLVGVLEVTPDGEAAREPRDADAPP